MRALLGTCLLAVWALWMGISAPLQAQNCDSLRYRHAIFSVQKTADIIYGNAPAMPAVYVNENVTVAQDLKLDIYQPIGDTVARRPLLMFAFGGGFLIGAKEDEDARALCDSFARKGYVTASINYRLGMNVSDANSGERAVFRAVQDWSAAIRYFKEFADTYRIDTNYIFAGGVSAGSISAMHAQYMSENERPASTYASGLPFPAPDLGCKNCSGNAYNHSPKVRALINAWGAIGDTAWMQASENTPMISFHGDLDAVVPYGRGFPFTALITLPRVDGSSLIHPRLQHLGIYSEFVPFPGEGHNIWGTVVSNNFVPGPTQHWDPILVDIRDFLWRYVEPTTGPVSGIGYSYPGVTETYSVPSQAGAHWCWSVTGGNIVSTNPYANTIDVQWQTLGLGSVTARVVSQHGAMGDASLLNVVVGPLARSSAMPAGIQVHIDAARGVLIVQAEGLSSGAYMCTLLDLQGRTCLQAQGAGTNTADLQVGKLPTGVYILHWEQDGQAWTKRIYLQQP